MAWLPSRHHIFFSGVNYHNGRASNVCVIFKLAIILFPMNIITKSVFLTLNVLFFTSISFQFSGIFCSGGNLYIVFLDLSFCCRKGDPFQGPKVGSCLTLGSELSEEIHVLIEQETLFGRDALVMSKRVKEPRTALPRGSQSQSWVLWGWD